MFFFSFPKWLDYYIFTKTISKGVNVWRAIFCINCMRILQLFLFWCLLVICLIVRTHHIDPNFALLFHDHYLAEGPLYILNTLLDLLLNLDCKQNASFISMSTEYLQYQCWSDVIITPNFFQCIVIDILIFWHLPNIFPSLHLSSESRVNVSTQKNFVTIPIAHEDRL